MVGQMVQVHIAVFITMPALRRFFYYLLSSSKNEDIKLYSDLDFMYIFI